MHMYRFETGGKMKAASGKRKTADTWQPLRSDLLAPRTSFLTPRSGFTLTELLVVITIIGILTSLITVAAVNAMRAAKRARITMEIQQISNALENFKTEYGSYPPNVYLPADLNNNRPEMVAVARDLQRFMKRAFSRATELQIDITSNSAPRRNTNSFANDNLYPIVNMGLTPAEALVFWLQGFSQDARRPLSGTDLVYLTTSSTAVTIESRKTLFEFDQSRLRPTRIIQNMARAGTANTFNVQLYEYLPAGSEQPYAYFDVSRRTPSQVAITFPTGEFFFSPTATDLVVAQKKPKTSVATPANWNEVEYVEQGKFQILHCGLDDIWGQFAIAPPLITTGNFPPLLFPSGPFIGDIGDTLTSFTTGTLEDAQE